MFECAHACVQQNASDGDGYHDGYHERTFGTKACNISGRRRERESLTKEQQPSKLQHRRHQHHDPSREEELVAPKPVEEDQGGQR